MQHVPASIHKAPYLFLKSPNSTASPSGNFSFRTRIFQNFRRRTEPVDEDEGGSVTVVATASDKPSKPGLSSVKKKGGKDLVSSLLSFRDEENSPADVPIKAKNLSLARDEAPARRKGAFGTGYGTGHKMSTTGTKDKAQVRVGFSNVFPQAGEYTPERLQELQRNTIRLGGVKPAVEAKPSSEPVVILKGVLKPEIGEQEQQQEQQVQEQTVAAVNLDEVTGMDFTMDDAEAGSTDIPDAARIAAAKAQRERKRKVQDYIPLSSDSRRELPDEPLKKDEAVSSEDEDDVRGRLAFISENGSAKAGVFQFETIEARSLSPRDNDDDEDEERKWEEEQLRKGAGRRLKGATTAVSAPTILPTPVRPQAEMVSVAQQAESVMMSLQAGLTRYKESYGKVKAELDITQQRISATSSNISSLKKNMAAMSDKYLYMQELRDYISDLCHFLHEKGSIIEELEEHMQKLREERADAMLQRRLADNSDEMREELMAGIGAATAIFSKGGSVEAASAQAAAAMAASASGEKLAPQLDEFGRDTNLQKQREAKLRAEARRRRAARALAKRATAGGYEKVEAESTSDESDSETAYDSGRREALNHARTILMDSKEEFSELVRVRDKLEEWKRRYRGTYRDAYMPISAPGIFAPYVRLELLNWDPLYSDRGLQSMNWYSLLLNYGDGADAGDDDSNLVPSLVEKVALPVLQHQLANCWDRLSTKLTKNAVEAVQEVLIFVPASSSALRELITMITTRLHQAVSEMDIPQWSIQVTTAVPQAARVAAYKFGTAMRLLRSIGLWKDVLARPVLEDLALDKLLVGKILPHLVTLLPTLHDAVTRTERVVAALVDFDVRKLGHRLTGLVQHVVSLSRALERKRNAGVEAEEIVGLARRIKQMLLKLDEPEKAGEVSTVFQL